MTFYVKRDATNKISGVYANLQPGFAEEKLEDSDKEVVDFLNPLPSVEEVRASTLRADPARADLLIKLKSASPAQIESYVDSNVTTIAQARTMFKAILKLIATDARA